jgi:heme A synthase
MSQPTPESPTDDWTWRVAAGISLVGALLVAPSLPAAGRLRTAELPRWLAVAAVALAVLTVLAGLGAVLLRVRGTDRGLRLQKRSTMVAGVLLMAATVLTGSAAVASLAEEPARASAPGPGLTIAVSGIGTESQLTVRATMPAATGDLVRAELTTVPEGGDRLVLAQQLTVARNDGPVSVALDAKSADNYDTMQILVESPHRRCVANLRPLISETPVISCKAR